MAKELGVPPTMQPPEKNQGYVLRASYPYFVEQFPVSYPEVEVQIWQRFGKVKVDLFASVESTHCHLWFSLILPALIGLDAVVQALQRLHLYVYPLIPLLPGVLDRVPELEITLLLVIASSIFGR